MPSLDLVNVLTMLALGASLGFLGGVFGIGGGIIAIPFLGIVFGMPQALAQGTSLAMMLPILLLGWWRYTRHHPMPWTVAGQIALLASLTAAGVARVATMLDPSVLRNVFSIFLILLALHMMLGRRIASGGAGPSVLHRRWMPLVGILGGASMGLLGVGGGLLATPLFVGLFGQRQAHAQNLSFAIIIPCSLVALLTYSAAGQVDWTMGLPLALGGVLTVSSGVALAHRLPERTMRRLFAGMILMTACWLLIKPLLMP